MNKPRISIIAAIASGNRALGKNGDLIYKIPEDLKRFKEITSGHPIIMGRKTFESIGRILPNRINIIITRDLKYSQEGAVVVHSLDEALRLAREQEILNQVQNDNREIFIIGGGQIYKEALPKTDRLYLTIVEGNPEADTFFPDYSEFKKVREGIDSVSNGLKYRYLTLER